MKLHRLVLWSQAAGLLTFGIVAGWRAIALDRPMFAVIDFAIAAAAVFLAVAVDLPGLLSRMAIRRLRMFAVVAGLFGLWMSWRLEIWPAAAVYVLALLLIPLGRG